MSQNVETERAFVIKTASTEAIQAELERSKADPITPESWITILEFELNVRRMATLIEKGPQPDPDILAHAKEIRALLDQGSTAEEIAAKTGLSVERIRAKVRMPRP